MTRLAVSILLLGWLAAASCSVDRKSSALACGDDHDCHDGRHCDRGYCIDPGSGSGTGSGNNGCPARCSSCDLTKLTCQINCDTGNACGDIDCPLGYSCIIRCIDQRACGHITCGSGGSCDVTCTGSGACGAIDCQSTCKCDVHCASGDCGAMACPALAVPCTRGEQAGAACDSSVDATCDLCP